MLAGGTAFAVTQLAGGDGPGSPEAAVMALLDAASNEDVIGLMEVLPTGERRVLQRSVEDLADQLTRLSVLDESLDLRSVSGIDLQFEDVELQTEELADGFVTVSVVGGTLEATSLPADLPLGGAIDDIAERLGEEPPELESEPTTETVDLAEEEPARLVTVREGGSWRVSIGYSVAEAARETNEWALPALGSGAPQGADSPEAAVESLIRAGIDLDARRAIDLLPPDEMAALHDYAPLFLPDVEADAAEASDDVAIELTDLGLEQRAAGGEALVMIRSFAFEIESDDETVTAAWDGECLRVTAPEEEDDFDTCELEIDGDPLELPELREVEYGVVTIEVGGRWYVSPTRTIFGALAAVLEAIPDDGLADIAEWFQDLTDLSIEDDVELDEGSLLDPDLNPAEQPPGEVFCSNISFVEDILEESEDVDFVNDPEAAYDVFSRLANEFEFLIVPPPEIEEAWEETAGVMRAYADFYFDLDPDDPDLQEQVDTFDADNADRFDAFTEVSDYVSAECGVDLAD
jgi:hypothetical protein